MSHPKKTGSTTTLKSVIVSTNASTLGKTTSIESLMTSTMNLPL